MVDTTFTIHKAGGTTVIADAATSAPRDSNRINRRETVSYTFRNLVTRLSVESGESMTIPSGETRTVDVADVSGTLTVDGRLECDGLVVQGGTLTGSGTVDVNERYALELVDLRRYREFAGEFSVLDTLNATKKFSETIDETVLSTLVVGIEPSDELQARGIPGVWGLVEQIRDERSAPLNRNGLSIRVRVLAPFSEYTTISDVTTTLKL